MNVTYLIGNGFDIACGLKTRYSDFIQSYLASPSADNCIIKFKKIIEKDLCTWSDAELAFGKYSVNFAVTNEFNRCFNDFLDCMADYFKSQQERMRYEDLTRNEISKMRKGIIQYQATLCEDAKKRIDQCITEIDCNILTSNYLIFNYTEVIEKMFKKCVSKSRNIRISKSSQSHQPLVCKVNSFEYAHGSLARQPLIFGVNDPDQIDFPVHRINQSITRTMVKPIENEETRINAFERCKQLISRSDVIIVYGMSIGLTDSLWWNLILNWLSANKKANLIIHYWDQDCQGLGAGVLINAREMCKNQFIANAKSTVHPERTLKDRIHVVINQNPFHIVMHAQ